MKKQVRFFATSLAAFTLVACAETGSDDTDGNAANETGVAAGNLKITPGTYELKKTPKDHSRQKRFSVVMFNEAQTTSAGADYFWPRQVIKVVQQKLKPEHTRGSYPSSDYDCGVESFTSKGGSFNAKGYCSIRSLKKRREWNYSGKTRGDKSFIIKAEQTGWRLANNGEKEYEAPEKFTISGKLVD